MNGVDLLASWLTPTVLFCVLNLMIGTIFVSSRINHRSKQPKSGDTDAVSPPQLARSSSLFERFNSIKLSFYRSESPYPAAASANQNIPNQDQAHQKPQSDDIHVTRSNSDTGTKAPAPSMVMKKSASEKVPAAEEAEEEGERRRPEKRGAADGGDEAVDARADDFINRFRHQLKMQRLDSLLRYRETLKTGAGERCL